MRDRSGIQLEVNDFVLTVHRTGSCVWHQWGRVLGVRANEVKVLPAKRDYVAGWVLGKATWMSAMVFKVPVEMMPEEVRKLYA